MFGGMTLAMLFTDYFHSDLILTYVHYVILFSIWIVLRKRKSFVWINIFIFLSHAAVLWFNLIYNSAGGMSLVWWFYELVFVWIQMFAAIIYAVGLALKKTSDKK